MAAQSQGSHSATSQNLYPSHEYRGLSVGLCTLDPGPVPLILPLQLRKVWTRGTSAVRGP